LQRASETPPDTSGRRGLPQGKADERSPLQWKARALRAVGNGKPRQAWLWADTLCRHMTGIARTDAYMLRSVAHALRGDTEAAEKDLRTAAEINPDSPALNRALMNSADAAIRLAAAKRLLRATAAEDRSEGIKALARAGFDCVGWLGRTDARLSSDLMWNGPRSIVLLAKTDIHEQSIPVKGEISQSPQAFAWSARIEAALPHQARAVTLTAPGRKAVFEPESMLLPSATAAVARDSATPNGAQLLIVVPVFDDRAATNACLESLLSALPATPSCRVVVVEDASPDAALAADLNVLAKAGRIDLLRNKINMGFAASVNRALELRHRGQDALLLNADTLVPAGAIEVLAQHVRRSLDIGTATPLSNNGEDTSFPRRFRENPLPTAAEIATLQAIAARVNRGTAIDMPNGVGFCLYINGAVLDRLGGLSNAFERGYYEDVEFCLRAAQVGFRNICAADAYVGHHGGRSFGPDKRALVVRNLRRLTASHPGYFSQARAFEKTDPLKEAIARIEHHSMRDKEPQHLLLLPADMPAFLERSIVRTVVRKHKNVLVIRAGERKGTLQLALTAANGASPQNLTWRFPAPAIDEAEIGKRFAHLRFASATIVDADAIPQAVAEVVVRRIPDITLVIARVAPAKRAPKRKDAITLALPKRPVRPAILAVTPAIRQGFAASDKARQMEDLDLSDLQQTEAPTFAETGVLAVIGISARDEDIALLRALGAALPGTADAPSIIIAGQLGTAHLAGLPANVHISGTVNDDEIRDWLSHLDAQAVLFADRKWGMADPRAALWQQAGLPVAWFGPHAANAAQGTALVLSTSANHDAVAQKIATWLQGAAA
jgi:GT2 family glycosyltransferase